MDEGSQKASKAAESEEYLDDPYIPYLGSDDDQYPFEWDFSHDVPPKASSTGDGFDDPDMQFGDEPEKDLDPDRDLYGVWLHLRDREKVTVRRGLAVAQVVKDLPKFRRKNAIKKHYLKLDHDLVAAFVKSEILRIAGKAPDKRQKVIHDYLATRFANRSGMRIIQALCSDSSEPEYQTVLYDPSLPPPHKGQAISFLGQDRLITHTHFDVFRLGGLYRIALIVITN